MRNLRRLLINLAQIMMIVVITIGALSGFI